MIISQLELGLLVVKLFDSQLSLFHILKFIVLLSHFHKCSQNGITTEAVRGINQSRSILIVMILSALLFKAILVAFLGFLDNWQADACSAPNIREKEGNEIKVIEVTSGKDVKLTCQIRIAGQTSKPRYYWLKDNQTLSPSSHHRLRLKLYRYLKIKRAKKEDTGFYTCVAVNDCGKNHFTMHLFVRTAPRFTVQQGKMSRNLLTVPVGHSVKLDCSAEGNPRPTVKWYKDGNLFKERKSGYRLYWSRWATMLILKGLVPSDAGSYMCNVSNSYGWINHTYKLNVHERTRAEPVVLPMENVTVYRGENASLTCKASSDSMPHFQWLRWFPLRSNGSANSSANSSADDSIETPHYEIMNKEDTDQYVILPPSDGKMFDFHGVKLTLFNVTKRDEGKYTCIVGNAVGYAVEHTYIIVQKMERARAEPVVLPMKNVTVYRGENASLTCKASSDSMPHFQWLRWFPLPSNGSANSSADDSIKTPHYEIVNKEDTDQHVILPPSDGKMFDFHGAKLTLFNVTKRDEGKYACNVRNAFGYAVEHTYIIVQNMDKAKPTEAEKTESTTDGLTVSLTSISSESEADLKTSMGWTDRTRYPAAVIAVSVGVVVMLIIASGLCYWQVKKGRASSSATMKGRHNITSLQATYVVQSNENVIVPDLRGLGNDFGTN